MMRQRHATQDRRMRMVFALIAVVFASLGPWAWSQKSFTLFVRNRKDWIVVAEFSPELPYGQGEGKERAGGMP